MNSGRPTRKRKAMFYDDNEERDMVEQHSILKKAKATKRSPEIVDHSADSPGGALWAKSQRAESLPKEKRSRQFRQKAPQSYLTIKSRALTQRLTVLSRERCGPDDAPEEKVFLAGSTGNVYTVCINLEPNCNCPHAKKGNQCKHIIYVMLRVLKAQEHVAYQLALIPSELRELIKGAPPIPGVETDGKDGTEREGEDSNRKPIEGECPICYDELSSTEAVVFCKTGCGNNIHKDCMGKWITMSRGKATCPYCRAKWPEDEGLEGRLGALDMKGLAKNEDGYANVASQLGLSGQRDYSSYHPFWVRQHLGDSRGR